MNNYTIGRITAEYKECYRVKSKSDEFLAKITGKQMFNAKSRDDYPAVGDWVEIIELEKNRASIQKILPRKTVLKKKYSGKEENQIIATNIDIAFIVESVGRDFNLNRFERYLVLVNEGKIIPVFVLNKIDLISKNDLRTKKELIKNRFSKVDIIPTSSVTESGLDKLKQYIKKEKTYCFLGSSGVGKSTLINKLLKKDVIKTKEISHSTNRGRHSTTNRQMYFLDTGGIVIDNPGMREIGLTNLSDGIKSVFNEIESLSKDCKYTDCSHINEPGCAVLEALNNKTLDEEKYLNYLKLKKEADFYNMTELEKRRKDRKFGKFIKKSLEQLKES